MTEAAPRLAGGGLSEFGERLRRRRTINDFKPRAVPRELLEQAVEIARWAPNHRLTEPWQFYLLGPETVHAVIELVVETKAAGKPDTARAALLRRMDGIPNWLAVTCRRSEDALREREDYAACCCAIQNMALYLWQAGVGLKWTTGAATRDPRLAEILGFDPVQQFVVGLFHCGYPEAVPEQRRRPVSEILRVLR